MAPEEREPPPATPDDTSADVSCPRIGILHLLVWTACVALYLAILRFLWQRAGAVLPDLGLCWAALTVLDSVCWGTALGGLVLWIARRWRGLAFPQHPGEYMLVVLGLDVAWRFVDAFAVLGIGPTSWTVHARLIVTLACYSLIYVWPALSVGRLHWRIFFLTLLAKRLADALMRQGLMYLWLARVWDIVTFVNNAPILLIPALLAVIFSKDRRDGNRHPWTHWVGVALVLWLVVGRMITSSLCAWLR